MRVKDICWLRSELEFPIKFEYKNPMIKLTPTIIPNSIEVYGILKDSNTYRGTTLVFVKIIKRELTKTSISREWLDLKRFIEIFGDFRTKE